MEIKFIIPPHKSVKLRKLLPNLLLNKKLFPNQSSLEELSLNQSSNNKSFRLQSLIKPKFLDQFIPNKLPTQLKLKTKLSTDQFQLLFQEPLPSDNNINNQVLRELKNLSIFNRETERSLIIQKLSDQLNITKK